MSDCYTNEYATHYAGCQCHEDAWRKKLSEVETRFNELRQSYDGLKKSYDEERENHWAHLESLRNAVELGARLVGAGERIMRAIEDCPASHKADVRARLDLACRNMLDAIAASRKEEG